MLSGDLATHLVGRYGAFRIQPLCLAEFSNSTAGSRTREYPTYGGVPMLK